MTPEKLLDILQTAAELKKQTRHNWTENDRKESVADHSWRLALLAMLLSKEEEFQKTDMNKVIRMCLIHDLGEAFTGDIPTFEKTEGDGEHEDALFMRWVSAFPEPQRAEWTDLIQEMIALTSVEARVYKALDKLEAVIAHNEADISTWLPLEYDLQFTYAVENTGFSPYLTALREAVDEVTRKKIKEA